MEGETRRKVTLALSRRHSVGERGGSPRSRGNAATSRRVTRDLRWNRLLFGDVQRTRRGIGWLIQAVYQLPKLNPIHVV